MTNTNAAYLVILPLLFLTLSWSLALLSVKLKQGKKTPSNELEYLALPPSIKNRMVSILCSELNVSIRLATKALEETNYDLDNAKKLLKVTSNKVEIEGLSARRVFTYLHEDSVGVMIEVSCKSYAAIQSIHMELFLQDLAKQIAVTNPAYISKQVKLDPFEPEPLVNYEYSSLILLDQVSVNPFYQKGKTMRQLLGELSDLLREPVVIKRFVRYDIT
jgi:hypothetical protein